ncbi:hypothetical protein WL56_17395 [Burkholderia cepacia]|nr:hypothetical protein WL56_17395 [Burkholderia cepacia]
MIPHLREHARDLLRRIESEKIKSLSIVDGPMPPNKGRDDTRRVDLRFSPQRYIEIGAVFYKDWINKPCPSHSADDSVDAFAEIFIWSIWIF